MKTRQQIKETAKQSFYANYWLCVAVNIVFWMLLSSIAGITAGLGTLILAGPLTIGFNKFCLNLFSGSTATFDTVFNEGFSNFGRKLGGYLWMQLFTVLWSLLLFVPGIIKSLSYAMTPYILGDCPNVESKTALKLSMRMMNGHKWELFVFFLSFIGWNLLSGLTFGILSIFFVMPYRNNSLAGYYSELKSVSLQSGVVSAEELA
ncbi:MAG: DUF975 family protein [Clostridia bacterium]